MRVAFFFLIFWAFAGESQQNKPGELGVGSGPPSTASQPEALVPPALKYHNCPTRLIQAFSEVQFKEKIGRSEATAIACDFNSGVQPAKLAPNLSLTEDRFVGAKYMNFDYASMKKYSCIPRQGQSDMEQIRLASVTSYTIEANDQRQQQLLTSITSIDSILSDNNKGTKNACGNRDLSERSLYWCKKLAPCVQSADFDGLMDNLQNDVADLYEKYSSSIDATSQYQPQKPGQVAQPLYFPHNENMEKYVKENMATTSPLLLDPEFRDTVLTYIRRNHPRGAVAANVTRGDLAALTKQYLRQKREKLAENFVSTSRQGTCLSTNAAALPSDSKVCDSQDMLKSAAINLGAFEERPISFHPKDAEARTQTSYALEVRHRLKQAQMCISAKNEAQETGEAIMNAGIDAVILTASVFTGGLPTLIGRGLRVARMVGFSEEALEGARIARVVSMAQTASKLKGVINGGGAIRDWLRSFSSCSGISATQEAAVLSLVAPEVVGPTCNTKTQYVLQEGSAMACLQTLASAGMFSLQALQQLQKLKSDTQGPLHQSLRKAETWLRERDLAKVKTRMLDPSSLPNLTGKNPSESFEALSTFFKFSKNQTNKILETLSSEQDVSRMNDVLGKISRGEPVAFEHAAWASAKLNKAGVTDLFQFHGTAPEIIQKILDSKIAGKNVPHLKPGGDYSIYAIPKAHQDLNPLYSFWITGSAKAAKAEGRIVFQGEAAKLFSKARIPTLNSNVIYRGPTTRSPVGRLIIDEFSRNGNILTVTKAHVIPLEEENVLAAASTFIFGNVALDFLYGGGVLAIINNKINNAGATSNATKTSSGK